MKYEKEEEEVEQKWYDVSNERQSSALTHNSYSIIIVIFFPIRPIEVNIKVEKVKQKVRNRVSETANTEEQWSKSIKRTEKWSVNIS